MVVVIVLVSLFLVVSGIAFKPFKKDDGIAHSGRFRHRL